MPLAEHALTARIEVSCGISTDHGELTGKGMKGVNVVRFICLFVTYTYGVHRVVVFSVAGNGNGVAGGGELCY